MDFSARWVELWQGALSLQILLTAKGNTPAGCAWTMSVCLQNSKGRDAKRIIQVTFLIGVGLCFIFLLDTAERAAAEQSLLFESKMATHSAYCFPVWAAGSGLGPFSPYFSWDYFCTKTGAGMRNACLRRPVSAALVLGTPSTSQVSFLAQQGRGRRCCGT